MVSPSFRARLLPIVATGHAPPRTASVKAPEPAPVEGMRTEVGVIYGSVAATGFRMAVSDPELKRTDYVQVRHDAYGWILGHVVDITRESTLRFEDAVRLGSGSGRDPDERLSGEVRVVGFRDARNLLQAPRTPFRAGDRVYRADDGLIAEVLGLCDTKGAYLGVLKGHSVRVHLDVNALVQKHVSVLAKTGSGKSYAVGVLIEELLKKGVAVVVIDPHGEYVSLAQPNVSADAHDGVRRFGVHPRGYPEAVVEFSPDVEVNRDALPLRLDGRNMSTRELSELVGAKVSNTQAGLLHQALKALKERGRPYALAEVAEEVRRGTSNVKWSLVSAIEHLQELEIFGDEPTPMDRIVRRGQVSVVNLRGVPPDVQEIVVARLAMRLFEARKLGEVEPLMMVLEEAHHFCPERQLATALSGEVLRTIASEGRKFGLGLTVVSQRPAKVDKNVLSQCNTEIVLKVTNPNDLKAVIAAVEGLTGEMEDEIQRLPVGVAVVSHPGIGMPLFCEIRPRETRHGGRGVDVVSDEDEPAEEEATVRAPLIRPARAPGSAVPAVPAVPAASAGAQAVAPGLLDEALRLVDASDLGKVPRKRLAALHEELTGMRERLDGGSLAEADLRRLLKRTDRAVSRVERAIDDEDGRGFFGRFMRR